MLKSPPKTAHFLGTILVAGSSAGIALSAGAVVALALLGVDIGPEHALLRSAAGAGIVLLAVTPVATLILFGIQALREGHGRTVLTVLGLLLIIACAVCLNLLGVRSA